MILKFVWFNDEEYNVYLNGNYICWMNHGDHGWNGMRATKVALERIAKAAGWEIEIEGTPGI